MGLTKNTDFQTMLNEYLPNDLLKEEFNKRDYLMSKVEKDENWLAAADGTYNSIIVPIKAAGASSVRYGKYTNEAEIAQDKYIRGKVTAVKELHGSMIFNQRDLMVHNKVNEQNFLKLLPGAIEDFMMYMKNVVSISLLSGRVLAKVTDVTNKASGVIGVSRPDRFFIGQLVEMFNATTPVYSDAGGDELYVIGVDISAKTITLSASRGGAAANVANAVVGYNLHIHDAYLSGTDQTLQNLPDVLLSASAGGSATYLGHTKATYPFLQAYNYDGSGVTDANIMEKIFDFVTEMRIYSKAAPTEVIMSLRNFAYCMKILEFQKGAYNVTPGSQKGTQYGWMEIEIGSVKGGMLKLVGIQEADDDKIIAIDWPAMKLYSDGGMRKRMNPDSGDEFYEIRNETGYQYIVDIDFFAEFVVLKPHRMGIMHSIP